MSSAKLLTAFGMCAWQGAKLTNANLRGANLQRAYLRDVNLRDAVSHSANGKNFKLEPQPVENTDIGICLVDVFWQDLEGAKLDGANLLGAIR